MVVFLIDQAEVFFRPCYTDIEQAPCFAKTGRSALVTLARDVACVDAIHDNGIELPALRAVERAEADAPCPLDAAREMRERQIEVLRGSVLAIIVAQTSHSCSELRAIALHGVMRS